MTDLTAWAMAAVLLMALAFSLFAMLVALNTQKGRGPMGPPGETGPMGMMGEPGICRCPPEKPAQKAPARHHLDRARHEAERIRFRAVVHWDDREMIGYGPHQATAHAAERDGQECIDRNAANWYRVERWTAARGWHELED